MNIETTKSGTSNSTYPKSDLATGSSEVQKIQPHSALQSLQVRIQTEARQTRITVSAIGEFKSALSSLKLAAQKFSVPATAENPRDLKASVNALLNEMANTFSKMKDASKAGGDAVRADFLRQLARSETFDISTRDALKRLGVTIDGKNGLSIDRSRLDSSMQPGTKDIQKTFKALSDAIQKAAGKVLDSGGSVESSLSRLSKQTMTLQNQQKAIDRANLALSNTQFKHPFGGSGYIQRT